MNPVLKETIELIEKLDQQSNVFGVTHVVENPLYHAPIEERLNDIRVACTQALSFLSLEGSCRTMTQKALREEGLREGEIALGNWIVRPRFK